MAEGRPDPLMVRTVAEVAKMLHVSERTIRRLIQRGELRAKYVGRRPLITDRELAAFLARTDRPRRAA